MFGRNKSSDWSGKLQFKDDIFSAMGAADLSDEEKGELLVKMLDLVEARVLGRVLDGLSAEDKEELEKIIDADDTGQWEVFHRQKVPQLEQIYKEEAEKVRTELVEKLKPELISGGGGNAS